MPEADQIEWPQDEVLFEIAWRAVSEGLLGNGIVTAGDLQVTATASNRETEVAAGSAWYASGETSLGSADTGTHSAGDGTNDRFDTVAWDTSTSSVVRREGTPAANPEPPDITGDELLLAWVYVPQNFDAPFSDSTHIFNWRPHATQAANAKYDDTAWTPTATTVKAALDELQEAAQATAYPFALGTDTDRDLDGSNLVDTTLASVALYEASNGWFRNEKVQALRNFTSDEVFSTFPLVIGTDVAAHLAGGDLLAASGGNKVYDGTEDHVPRARVDDHKATTTVTSSTYTTSDEEVVLVDTSTIGAASTITLASADAADGNTIVVTDLSGAASTHNITVDTEGSETIHGETSKTISTDGGALVFTSDGTNWALGGGGSGGGGGGTEATEIFEGRESGSVSAGNQGILVVDNLAAGEKVEVYKAVLTTATVQAVPTSVDLKLVTFDNAGAFSTQATLITGDGSTVFDDQTGSPLGSYTNSGTTAESIGVLVDNQTTSAQEIMAAVEGETGL